MRKNKYAGGDLPLTFSMANLTCPLKLELFSRKEVVGGVIEEGGGNCRSILDDYFFNLDKLPILVFYPKKINAGRQK